MTRKKQTRWTIDTYSDAVWQMYQRTVYVIPGQEYINTYTKLWHYCTKHGAYQARPNHILKTSIGSQCKKCDAEREAARKYAITMAFVGSTTPDGHLILEHVGYQSNPSQRKTGRKGAAVYRYECAQCGNTEATAVGASLKKSGHTTGCKECHSKRETIERHLKNKKKALEPCQFYIADVHYGDYLKIGISKNYDQRAAAGNSGNPYYDSSLTPEEHYQAGNLDLAYEHCWFLSEPYPRAWIFSIEQIILRASEMFRPSKPIPKEMIEVLWSGQTELRDWHMGNEVIENAFHKLLKMIQDADGDWYQVYCQQFDKFVLG